MSELESTLDKTVNMANKIMRDANIFLKMSNSESTSSEEVLKHSDKYTKSVSNLSFGSPALVPGKKIMSSAIPAPSHKTLAYAQDFHDDSCLYDVQGPQAALPSSLPSAIHIKILCICQSFVTRSWNS
jgi:hypothetical protein